MRFELSTNIRKYFNPLNPQLNPIYYLLALLGAHHFLHASRIRVKKTQILNFVKNPSSGSQVVPY